VNIKFSLPPSPAAVINTIILLTGALKIIVYENGPPGPKYFELIGVVTEPAQLENAKGYVETLPVKVSVIVIPLIMTGGTILETQSKNTDVGVTVGVGVLVGVIVGVCVLVGVFVGVDVFVGVSVFVGVCVALISGVLVFVGV
jgi:hypothetical protein